MKRVALTVVLLGLACSVSLAEKYTYVDLVNKLTDLESLSVLPVPGEKCVQWSSYDRASKYDEATGKYIGWSANGDGGGIIRQEGDLSVFAEMEGPGVIWRIWSASAGDGHVKIYLDGASEPKVDLPFKNYFDGKIPPFQGKALCHKVAAGLNNYVPIPFQKSCKIVGEKGWGNYYHFTYTVYPKDTQLPIFSMKLSEEETAALKKANDFLESKCGSDPAGERKDEKTIKETVTLKPGETERVARIKGERAITAMRVKVENMPAAPDDFKFLRELTLKITFDKAEKPQVWSPLGDFFGSAPGFKKYSSLPLGMTDDGMYCLWYMPFDKRADIEVVNESDAERTVSFEITYAPLTRPIEALARFHAKWHRDAFNPPEPERAEIDWNMLKTEGRGRFLGVMLHVWNPRGGWWGEGDEKFYIDGEKFPSTIGTGSEDYFGYAWCCPELFYNAFHNQPHNDGDNRGHVCVNRWHITDNIPFQTSFEGAIEKYYPNKKPTLYSAITYWYSAAGDIDPYEPVPVEERTAYCTMVELPGIKGAIEGEKMKVLEKTGGGPGTQDMGSFGDGWSGLEHLWWTGAKPGDKLTLALPVEEDGKYKITIQLTKANDYGMVQFSLDGKKLGDIIDLYNTSVVPTGAIDMGVLDLTKGEHRLMIEITGANEQARKSYMVGLDYVKLDKQ